MVTPRRPWFLPGLVAWLSVTLSGVVSGEEAASEIRYFRHDRGVAQGSSRLPERFDDPERQRWRTEVDPGHSTPIVVDRRIFLTAFTPDSRELSTLALDLDSGRILWRRPVSVTRVEDTHPIGSPATPTPASDGQRVYALFGSYGLLCYDLDGELLWEHRMGPFQDEYGAGSSPVLVGNKVIVNQDHDVDSFLAAFDAASGKLLWRTPRPDAVRSYATPAVWQRGDRTEVLVAGALELAAYNSDNGERSWSYTGLARIVIPTPIPSGDMIYMASWAPGGDTGQRISLETWSSVVARSDKDGDGKLARSEITNRDVLDRFFRMDIDQNGLLDEAEWNRHAQVFRRAQNALLALRPNGRGDLTEDALVWKHLRGVPYVSTPVVDLGRVWMVKDGGIVTMLDSMTGERLNEERVPGTGRYFASPIAGDGKVYTASEQGVVTVIANQPEWKVISSHPFEEAIYATPVPVGNSLLIRTAEALYRFE